MRRTRILHLVQRVFLVICSGTGLLLTGGCGGDTGPTRYQVSGKVSFAGQPVPAGSVHFAPDTSKGNKGPATVVTIEDGQYNGEGAKGTVGGPHVVTIYGFDGKPVPEGGSPQGTAIFTRYETTVELPKESTSQDFDIPKGGAKAPKGIKRRSLDGQPL